MTIDKGVLRMLRTGLIIILMLLVVVVAVGALREEDTSEKRGETNQWVEIKAGAISERIGLVGKIEPQKTITLTAPFEGEIHEVLVEPGQRVQAGEQLLRMNPAVLEVQLRSALAAQLKARRVVQELQRWSHGNQVNRARRAVRGSEMSLSSTERRFRESQALFERGIIARMELDDLNQMIKLQTLDLTAAKDELRSVLEQGGREQLQIAEMELHNATVGYEVLQALMKSKEIVAPFEGVVIPVASTQDNDASVWSLQAGRKVTQGQPLFGLSNIEALKVVSKVSELDINKLHTGQRVEIQGDGFDGRLDGVVAEVGNMALVDFDSDEGAQFPVTLSISALSQEQLKVIRLGMSVRLNIVTYQNEEAMVVPPSAIKQIDGQNWLEYRADADQPVQRLPVTTGHVSLEGVEVIGVPPGLVRATASNVLL